MRSRGLVSGNQVPHVMHLQDARIQVPERAGQRVEPDRFAVQHFEVVALIDDHVVQGPAQAVFVAGAQRAEVGAARHRTGKRGARARVALGAGLGNGLEARMHGTAEGGHAGGNRGCVVAFRGVVDDGPECVPEIRLQGRLGKVPWNFTRFSRLQPGGGNDVVNGLDGTGAGESGPSHRGSDGYSARVVTLPDRPHGAVQCCGVDAASRPLKFKSGCH